ncbi:MAG: GWxTD domain-containing protein, partial [Deltaproteobacteria bacterium]
MIVFGCLLALVGATSLPAQTVTEEAHRVLAEGVTAFEAEDYARAAALLEPVVAVTPALADDRWGSAAYWLGRAYEHLDERERMQEAWRAGFRALEAAGLFDLRLADAYLRSLSDEQRVERADEAASLYLGLLSVLGQPLLPDEQALLARHMAQLALILPEALWDDVFDVGPGAVSDPQAWTYRPEAGERLLAWWRSQDPLPATRRNERLHEHLVRVAYAERHFAYAGNPSGLDDRGEIYVRFGKPDKELEIRFTEPWLVDIVFQPGVGVSPSDFPENVFWRYGHIDRATYYLFVKKQDHFVIGETMDLLPSVLRFGFSPSERGVDKAVRMLAVLRSVYQQLAPLHSDFEARYSDVENYVMELPAFQPGRILNRTRRSVPLPPSPAPPSGRARPDVFAQTILLRTQTEDEIAYGRRENYSPLQATEVFRDRERLPIVTRVARFLDGDGTTRTEIYWSPPAGALYPDKKMRERLQGDGYRLDDYVINMTAVQMTADYRQRVVNQKRYFLTGVPPGDEGTIPVQTMVVRGDTGLYHLALQWDQYLPEGQRGRRVRIGPHVKVGTESIDSLRALRSDGRTLEMSDLKPLLARDGGEALL